MSRPHARGATYAILKDTGLLVVAPARAGSHRHPRALVRGYCPRARTRGEPPVYDDGKGVMLMGRLERDDVPDRAPQTPSQKVATPRRFAWRYYAAHTHF